MVGFVALLKSRIVLAGWIVYWLSGLYQLDRIAVLLYCWISLALDRIGWIGWIGSSGLAGLDHNGWTRTHSFCKDGKDGMDGKYGTDGMDGLDGALLGLVWDEQLLAPAGTRATEQEHQHWLSGYCKQGTNGTDGLDGSLVGQGWDGQTLEGAGTGSPPCAPEQEHHYWILRGSALCEVLAGTNFVGAEYLCWRSKIIHIECTQIRTSNVAQYSIKRKHNTIILWLHITVNRTKIGIAEKCRSKY